MLQSALCGERVVTDIAAATAATLLEICVATHLPGMQAVLVWGVLAMLVMVKLGRGVQLIKRDLSGYKLARCNDGTDAAYYHSPVCYANCYCNGRFQSLILIVLKIFLSISSFFVKL